MKQYLSFAIANFDGTVLLSRPDVDYYDLPQFELGLTDKPVELATRLALEQNIEWERGPRRLGSIEDRSEGRLHHVVLGQIEYKPELPFGDNSSFHALHPLPVGMLSMVLRESMPMLLAATRPTGPISSTYYK